MEPDGSPNFLAGGGEMGALLRSHGWAQSVLGAPARWPSSLKATIRIMLTSRQPIWVGWGGELTFFYNDAYRAIIGGKHPWALGRPAEEVWREIWADIGPMLATAMGGIEGTYVEEQLLIMERNGYPEETYYTFSYSPISEDDGRPGGIICANTDDTKRVFGERQLALLRDLSVATAHTRSWREVCARAATALLSNPYDLPFAMIYMAESEARALSLVGSAGIAAGHPAAPATIPFGSAAPWRLDDVLRTHETRLVTPHDAGFASQLLAFGRRQPLAPKVVNLGRFVRGLDDLLRRALGDGVEIETVISGGLWNTLVDPSQVENAILNLAINARDAMQAHGKLTIEAGNAALTDDTDVRHEDVRSEQYVMLAVTDTGCGMTPEVVEHVFEPFFTTKPEGQGTGLGLSMVYGFVKQSGGHIKIDSEPGRGTTIRLYLPRASAAEDVVAEDAAGSITGGSETVLVVEDDDEVRATVVELLGDLGYRVLEAADAQSALAIIESGAAIDVLFTDVVMPGPVRSPELARQARARLPEVAVLFTSGYTDNAIVHGGRLDQGIDLLSKPYTRETLARRIRHVLRNQERRAAGVMASHRTRPPLS